MAVLDNQRVNDTCALFARIIHLYTALSQRHVCMYVCNTVNGYDTPYVYSIFDDNTFDNKSNYIVAL